MASLSPCTLRFAAATERITHACPQKHTHQMHAGASAGLLVSRHTDTCSTHTVLDIQPHSQPRQTHTHTCVKPCSYTVSKTQGLISRQAHK
jgi:hypothetical protein